MPIPTLRRHVVITALLFSLAASLTALPAVADGAPVPARSLYAFRGGGHFGGIRLGGSRFGRRPGGFGLFGRRRGLRSTSFLHRVARTLALAYLFHLFFSHGGLSILLWIVIIALVVHLMRRRRRRYAY